MTYPPPQDPYQPPRSGPPYPPQLPPGPHGVPPTLWDGRPVSGQPVSPMGPYAAQPPMSMPALFSMILGITGVVTSCCSLGIPSIAAVILGHIALPKTNRKERGGHGMAVAGLVMGYVMVAPAIVFTLWFGFGMVMSVLGGAAATPTPTDTP